jgi:radical SAM protein with 4Fe4S-binding SPASM domain
MEAIALLQQAQIPITVKTSWMKQNWRQYNEIVALVERMGVYFRGSPDILSQIDGNVSNRGVSMTPDELVEFYQMAAEPEKTSELPRPNREVGGKPPCNIGRSTIAISPSGDLFPCLHLRQGLGHILRDGFVDIWRSSPVLNQLRTITTDQFQKCTDCSYRSDCFVCIGEAWQETGQFTVPAEGTCTHARARHQAGKNA